jgi:hypothetical protein
LLSGDKNFGVDAFTESFSRVSRKENEFSNIKIQITGS